MAQSAVKFEPCKESDDIEDYFERLNSVNVVENVAMYCRFVIFARVYATSVVKEVTCK